MSNQPPATCPPPEMGDRFHNSPAAVARFPFPFDGDSYMYSVNLKKAGQGGPGAFDEHWFDVDEHYAAEMELRAKILARDPDRVLSLPHMREAEWDLLALIMEKYSADYPQWFALEKAGDRWRWRNRLLQTEQEFVFGRDDTLPLGPLEFITRQAQGDWILLDQRDGDLYMDAGMLTFPADWSLRFDLGMTFEEWHGPVPLAHEMGVFQRAKQFLMRIQPAEPWQRFNWTMTVGRRWDTSSETYHEWGASRAMVTPENVGSLVHLRVEVQVLARLPRTHALLFLIRTYLISLEELSAKPAWARRLRRVLASLPPELVEYKGLTRYRQHVVDWLAPFDQETLQAA